MRAIFLRPLLLCQSLPITFLQEYNIRLLLRELPVMMILLIICVPAHTVYHTIIYLFTSLTIGHDLQVMKLGVMLYSQLAIPACRTLRHDIYFAAAAYNILRPRRPLRFTLLPLYAHCKIIRKFYAQIIILCAGWSLYILSLYADFLLTCTTISPGSARPLHYDSSNL